MWETHPAQLVAFHQYCCLNVPLLGSLWSKSWSKKAVPVIFVAAKRAFPFPKSPSSGGGRGIALFPNGSMLVFAWAVVKPARNNTVVISDDFIVTELEGNLTRVQARQDPRPARKKTYWGDDHTLIPLEKRLSYKQSKQHSLAYMRKVNITSCCFHNRVQTITTLRFAGSYKTRTAPNLNPRWIFRSPVIEQLASSALAPCIANNCTE